MGLEIGQAHLLCYNCPHDTNDCDDAKRGPDVLHAALAVGSFPIPQSLS
jgi:hypothetical protein